MYFYITLQTLLVIVISQKHYFYAPDSELAFSHLPCILSPPRKNEFWFPMISNVLSDLNWIFKNAVLFKQNIFILDLFSFWRSILSGPNIIITLFEYS